MLEASTVPHHYVDNLAFGVYSSKEIKDLSVKEVTNSQVFDALMHPTFGGLYDQAFGPQERNDVCTTCGLGTLHCPGHMGHITLPLPVYNPILFKTLFSLLRGTCFTCTRMMVTTAESSLFQKQILLLDHGLVSEAEQLKDVFQGLVHKSGPSMEQEIVAELEKYTENILNDVVDLVDAKRKANVKHVTESRQQLIKRFIRGDFFSRICNVCRNAKKNLRTEHNTKIFFSYKPESAQKLAAIRKKKEIDRKLRLKRQMENPDIDEPEEDDEENVDPSDKVKPTDQQYLTPLDVQKHMREVWKHDSKLLRSIMGVFTSHIEQDSCGTDIFFLEVIPVPPSRFRPISRMQDKMFENAQTSNLNKVVSDSWTIRELLGKIQELQKKDVENTIITNLNLSQLPETALKENLQSAWLRLQISVNVVFDSDLDKINKDKHPGIRQLLEKKSGLFRKNMMGKRVNFAARSVISPDPYISTNEIGIPLIFAKCLTYPQPVTPWNFQELKQAVINGPDVHPGAVMVENEDGFVTLLKSRDAIQREAIAKQLLTPAPGNKHKDRTKKVYRHLKNGDVLLLNRQPTLHRPSMQAHKARVLPGQKTLRLHYANCKAYNADFDGDEMNAHFPQNEICRAEAYNLASTDYNYLVPKDGTPLAGLIQDHMVSGVKLTMRGRHVSKAEYQQLVYGALTDTPARIKLLPPCMIKPQVLWSGKQVLSTVLLNVIPEGRVPLNLEGKAKTAGRNWQNRRARHWLAGGKALVGDDMSESEVVIHQGQLLVGVLDKGHYGNTPYGLVHCVYELYGGPVAGKLLTALARLFTTFLQWVGFTLGVSDILVTPKADRRRKKAMRRGARTGNAAAAKAAGVDNPEDEVLLKKRLEEMQFAKDDGEMKDLDLQMKGQTDEIQNSIANCVMPIGLLKRFPENNLQLMVQAGAKGSSVNCMQISCLLGQIELEGHRPPLTLSGQALPSFLAYDTCPRAGGFVDGRFLTGIRPQEYFYHCMAGREGLIDTAVKTSRSGYLQRCIIKHLEGLVVGYDMTVRDSDGSVVQFQYGEDGIDVMKTQFLKKSQFPFLIKNKEVIGCGPMIEEVQEKLGGDKKINLPEYLKCPPKKLKKLVRVLRKRFKKWKQIQPSSSKLRTSPFLSWCEDHYDQLVETLEVPGVLDTNGRCTESTLACTKWAELSGKPEREHLEKKLEFVVSEPDPFCSVLRPDRHFGVTTERFEDVVEQYIREDPDRLLATDGSAESEDTAIDPDELKDMLNLKHIQSLSYPGEAVGLIAAQSIGEPSTQMTLNTFHFAGRGEMNVTLGIPRLREILMVASLHIKTPSMDIPVLDTAHAKKKAKLLQKKFNKVHLSEVLEDVEVNEYLSIESRGKSRMYQLRFNFLPHEMYKDEFYLTPARVLSHMEKTFFERMALAIKNRLNEMTNSSLLHNSKVKRTKQEEESSSAPAADDDTEDILDDDFHDNDAAAQKSRQRQDEELEYEGEEGERDEVEEESEEEADVNDESPELNEEDEETVQSQESKLRKLKFKRKSVKEMNPKRISAVLNGVAVVSDYTYDADEELWCEVTFKFPLSSKKLDMTSLVKTEAGHAVVCQTKGIRRCFLTQSKKLGEEGLTRLKTDGINIIEMFNYQDILDLNQLYSNDIHAIANIYGIEAASRVIIKEVRDVFAAYGIEVDYRHLSLVADYMTFEGTYKSFSRRGIESNASPLQKITFETSMNFLKSATLQGSTDDLKSPSSRLVVGSLVHGGTGAFDIIQPS